MVHRRVVNRHMAGVNPRKVDGHTPAHPRSHYLLHQLRPHLRLPVLSLHRLE